MHAFHKTGLSTFMHESNSQKYFVTERKDKNTRCRKTQKKSVILTDFMPQFNRKLQYVMTNEIVRAVPCLKSIWSPFH